MTLSDEIISFGYDSDCIMTLKVKEFIAKIKNPIKSELNIAKKYGTKTAIIVKLLLNQILKQIDKEAGEGLTK